MASSVDGYMRVYDLRMQKLLQFMVYDDETLQPINSFDVLNLQPNFLAISSLDSTVRLLDITDGQIISQYKGGHQTSDYHGSVKFTKDGNYLVQASEDGKLVLYDISKKQADSQQIAGKMAGHSMPVISVDVASGNRVVSGSADGTARLWTYA